MEARYSVLTMLYTPDIGVPHTPNSGQVSLDSCKATYMAMMNTLWQPAMAVYTITDMLIHLNVFLLPAGGAGKSKSSIDFNGG